MKTLPLVQSRSFFGLGSGPARGCDHKGTDLALNLRMLKAGFKPCWREAVISNAQAGNSHA